VLLRVPEKIRVSDKGKPYVQKIIVKKSKNFQKPLDICLLTGYTIADSGGTVPLQKTAF
jgi:hypothetical protein